MRLPRPSRPDRFTFVLGMIAIGALVIRVVYVLRERDLAVLSDGFHYHQGAVNLADGRGFINPLSLAMSDTVVQDAVHPPAWESVLAVASLLGMRSYLSHQLVAALVGTAAVVVVGLVGREAFGARVGLIAAALAAVYANFWLYERDLVSEPLALLAVGVVLLLTYRFRTRPSLALSLALGAAVAVASLTRSELLLFGPLMVAPVVLTRASAVWRIRLGWLAAAGATCVLVLAPWAIYNSTRFERFVPLSNGAGSAMLTGNCPGTYEGANYAYYDFACVTLAGEVSQEPSVADDQYRAKAIRFIRANASEAPVVALARLGRAFNVFRPFQQVHLESERGSPTWVLRLALYSYWMLAPMAIAGIFVARRRSQAVWPLLVVILIVVLAIAPSIGAVRYRAPAEVPIVLLAAVAIDAALRRWLPGLGRTSERAFAGAHPVEPTGTAA